jgi:RNA polymerase sigma factor (sigma-70 family)
LPSYNQHTNLSDEQLLQAYRRDGDNQWLGYLLQRYTGLLLGVALKYLKDRSAAEDAVQHVFETTLTRLPQEPILNFKGWLYILMRNHCLQLLRDRTFNAGEDLIAYMPAQELDKEELNWQEHTLAQMNEALQMLNEEQRVSVTLFYLERRSYEQIIASTGYTFMQVKSYIQNGKRNLKTILTKKLGEPRQ